jgi:hypothetical protein
VEGDERVHPAAMGGSDEEVTAFRQVLLTGRPDAKPEHDEQDETTDQPEEAIEE